MSDSLERLDKLTKEMVEKESLPSVPQTVDDRLAHATDLIKSVQESLVVEKEKQEVNAAIVEKAKDEIIVQLKEELKATTEDLKAEIAQIKEDKAQN